MDLKDKYFHSIHAYIEPFDNYDLALEVKLNKFKKILETGYIMCRDELSKRDIAETVHPNKNINGKDCISVSRYKNSETDYDRWYKAEFAGNIESAFDTFPLQQFSIVLDSKIEEELKMFEAGIYLERQIYRSIPLKYMVAISVFDYCELIPFFNEMSQDDFDRVFEYNYKYDRGYKIKELDEIRRLLKQYNYNVPIVSVNTGNAYHDNEDYREYINNRINKGSFGKESNKQMKK